MRSFGVRFARSKDDTLGEEQDTMTLPLATYRGFVNTWECDEMGHMNVQFYMAKLDESLHQVRAALGLPWNETRRRKLALRNVADHVRFLNEQPSASTLEIRAGVAAADKEGITVYSEMTNPATSRIAATFQSRLEAYGMEERNAVPIPDDILERAQTSLVTVPEHGAARGVAAIPELPLTSLDGMARAGAPEIYRGAVMPRHCDVHGWNAQQFYAGRVSDGAPHLWMSLGLDRATMMQRRHGVAVVEFSWRYAAPLWPGDIVAAHSMVREVGRKTVVMVHGIFDAASGAAVGASQAVAVVLDLDARRAVELHPDERARLERGIVEGVF